MCEKMVTMDSSIRVQSLPMWLGTIIQYIQTAHSQERRACLTRIALSQLDRVIMTQLHTPIDVIVNYLSQNSLKN